MFDTQTWDVYKAREMSRDASEHVSLKCYDELFIDLNY